MRAKVERAYQATRGIAMIQVRMFGRIWLVMMLLSVGFTASADIRDKAVLEAYIDGVMHASMDEHNVAGAVVVVTTPDEVLLSKGYGYADVDKGMAVSAEETLFRIGSVSKLFVWLPLMQMLESGDIDLDTDINSYMKSVQVPEAFGEPVTIKHLMTHTPGFEDHVIGLFGRDASTMLPLDEILNREMPLRVRAPGTYASYSNHGVGMASMIIEDISGMSWSDYVEQKILQPLDMQHTTTRQPLPADMAPQMSKGYLWEAGKFVEKPFEFVPLGPAGGVSASGKDMAIFLQQFLNLGEVNGTRVLSQQYSERMQSVLHRAADTTNGLLHGFYETSEHGQRIFGHGGDTMWFHSAFMVMPDAGIGFFISTNSATGGEVRGDFRSALLDRYFPEAEIPSENVTPADRTRLAGTYGMIRHAHDDLTRIAKLLAPVAVQPMPDGTLMLAGLMLGEDPLFLEEVETGVFREVNGKLKLTFDLSGDGPASHVYLDAIPIIAIERLSGLDSPALNQLILFAVLAMTLWILIVWTVQSRTSNRWHNDVVASFRTRAYILAALSLVFLISLAIGASDQTKIVFGLATSIKLTLALAWIIAVVVLLVLWRTPGVLSSGDVTAVGKIGYAFIAATAVLWLWFLYHWRLMVFWN